MDRTHRRAALGAAAVIATLLTSGAGPALAAAPSGHGHGSSQSSSQDRDRDRDRDQDRGGKGGKGHDAAKLAKVVGRVDADLERLVGRAERKLGTDDAVRVAANIEVDRARLADLTTVAEVRALRPENYDQVIGWLRKVERLTPTVEAPDPAVTEAAAAVVEQLLAISATSEKDELRAARHQVRELRDLVEAGEAGDSGTDDSGTDDSGTDDSGADDSGGDSGSDDDSDEDEDEDEVEHTEGGH